MNCDFCESPLTPGARYCPSCGTAVIAPEPENAYQSPKAGTYPPHAPYAPAYNPPSTSSLAVISLLCGIATWLLFPVLPAIGGVITGHMARREIRESNGWIQGDVMAVIGLCLSYAQLVLIAVVLLVVIVFVIGALVLHHG